MRALLIVLAITLAGPAQGRCLMSDSWTGPDKTKHALGGAVIGSVGTLVFKKPKHGFWAGAAAGAAVELYSAASGRGVCTFQDFAVTAAGAAAGAYGTGWIVIPQRRGIAVAYVRTL